MNELRKDYVLDRWVIIARNRAKRPDQFVKKDKSSTKNDKDCFFCPGNEHLTPNEITRVGDKNKWSIRVIPNKFAAVELTGNPVIQTDNSFFTYASAYGHHEIIVETDNHKKQMHDFKKEHMVELLNVYIVRINELYEDEKVKYVSVFKNYGLAAGASLKHSHTQIVAYNHVPETVNLMQKKSQEYIKENDRCPYCVLLDTETKSDRTVSVTNNIVSFTPYASRFPFEVWMVPLRHISSLCDFNDAELVELSEHILLRLKSLMALGDIAYNIEFISYRSDLDDFHMHVAITPRVSTWAGFEISTGTIINTMSPEIVAEFYREK